MAQEDVVDAILVGDWSNRLALLVERLGGAESASLELDEAARVHGSDIVVQAVLGQGQLLGHEPAARAIALDGRPHSERLVWALGVVDPAPVIEAALERSN